jgi:hypothetical protein
MEKKPYEAPRVFELGTVKELTAKDDLIDKCGGSADVDLPQVLSPQYSLDCP